VGRKIKADSKTAQVSVLQVSASFVASEDRAKALEIGADGYLTHPIDGLVLVATIRSLLRVRTAELAARSSAAQWQSAFDALSEGLAFVDTQGHIAQLNKAFARMCGLRCPCERPEQATELFQRVFGNSEPLLHTGEERYSAEFQLAGKAIEVTVDPVRMDGVHIGKLIVLTDITDRKLAEYAMRTAEKIAATGKLAHAIAHEINNPLEAVVNLVYLARTVAGRDDVRQYLTFADEELARIGRITKQSLSFYRDTTYAVPVDVGNLVAETIALYEKVAAARQVQIVCHQRPTLALDAFPGQLKQVFGNLLRNAIEATPPNTSVVVRVRSASRRGRHGAQVTIHDRGPGIPKEVQGQIFDPFFTTKELKGSGLGLWVSKALVLKHQGSLRVRSSTKLGATGTIFSVFLPVGGIKPGMSDQDQLE
jgi:PAS domain S-box-containing protein